MVVGEASSFRSGHMCRALCCRLARSPPHTLLVTNTEVAFPPDTDPLAALPAGYALHHPRALCCSTTGLRLVGPREAAAPSSIHAIAWNAADKTFELIDTRCALRQRAARYCFAIVFGYVYVLDSVPSALLTFSESFREAS